jgi:hypothetical protein
MYNESFINNSVSLVDFTSGMNTESNGMFAYLILIVIFIITFIALKHYSTNTAGVSACFTTTLVALLMLSINWISFQIFIIPLVLLMFSIIISKFIDN